MHVAIPAASQARPLGVPGCAELLGERPAVCRWPRSKRTEEGTPAGVLGRRGRGEQDRCGEWLGTTLRSSLQPGQQGSGGRGGGGTWPSHLGTRALCSATTPQEQLTTIYSFIHLFFTRSSLVPNVRNICPFYVCSCTPTSLH